MEKITSLNNSKIMLYSKLIHKKYRDEYNMFLLENYKLISEAVKRNNDIESIIIREDMLEKYIEDFELNNDKIIVVPENVFTKISDTVTSQGIIGVVKKKAEYPIQLVDGKTLVLDRLQDAGNLGTLLRSAIGFNFKTILLIDCVDIYNPKVVRSCGGSIFSLNIVKCTENEVIELKNNKNFTMLVADMKGKNLYRTNIKNSNLMVIIGNEGKGVSENLKNTATDKISIPMNQELESLNAGVSGSIIMSYFNSKN